MRIFLDNAATTPLSESVLQVMLPFLREQYGNPSSSHAEGRAARAAIERARKTIAGHLRCSASELIFTSGGTEANNMAIKCAVRDLGIKTLISSCIEHACVLNACKQAAQQHQIPLHYVALQACGQADLTDLERLLAESPAPALISLMQAHNELGTLNQVQAIGELCQRYGAYFHTDTVQSVGHLELNAECNPADFFSASAHKLHGPKGAGLLFVRRGRGLKALIDGGGQERQLRSGTENVAGIIGLAEAIDQAYRHFDQHQQHILSLRQAFLQVLEQKLGLEGFRINGPKLGQAFLPTVLNLGLFTSLPSDMLLFHLDLKGLSASAGSACSSGAQRGSHVMNSLGLQQNQVANLRFSFSNLTRLDEVEQGAKILAEVILQHPPRI